MYFVYRILAQINIPEDTLQIPKTDATDSTVTSVLSVAFAVLGAVSFLVIILSGLRFSLSRGNAESVAKARNSIVYAGIGLALSVMAFSIVRFIVRSA